MSHTMRTFTAKPESVQRDWYIVDASSKTLGRVSSEVASRLRGKHKPEFTPHVDTGDYIILVNTDKIQVKGNNKPADKMYRRHSNYPGGLKETSFADMMKIDSRKVAESAVRGMLPKNALGREMFKKLKVYKDEKHPHAAQQPKIISD